MAVVTDGRGGYFTVFCRVIPLPVITDKNYPAAITLSLNKSFGENATEKPDPYFCSPLKMLQKYGSGFFIPFPPGAPFRARVECNRPIIFLQISNCTPASSSIVICRMYVTSHTSIELCLLFIDIYRSVCSRPVVLPSWLWGVLLGLNPRLGFHTGLGFDTEP